MQTGNINLEDATNLRLTHSHIDVLTYSRKTSYQNQNESNKD